MANCRICNSRMGFKAKTAMHVDNIGANGGIINSLDVCEDCYEDMGLLKKGDLQTYIKIHSIVDKADPYLKKFIEIWETIPEEVLKKQEEERKQKEDLANSKKAEISKMLISSGFHFDGYKIVKYSGYISGDDAVQIPRSGIFGSDNGKKLTDALVKIRIQALKELKEAAYALGCNAIIGVDFDYLTLEPETANLAGGTHYEPYVICVTANGNAVVIEKE